MTKKDYIKLAQALKDSKPTAADEPNTYFMRQTWNYTVHKIVQVLADDNPRFDATRFYAACGMD